MKHWLRVQLDIDLLRLEQSLFLILAKEDHSGKLDETGVEMEHVRSGVGGWGRDVLLGVKGGCGAGSDQQMKDHVE